MKKFITGVNHFGLSVADLDESIDFYKNILGLEMTERRETDAFFQISPVSVIALLQYPGGKEKFDSNMRPDKKGKAFTHYGFEAPSKEAVFEFEQHLIENNIEITKKAYERWDGASVYFTDPNGHTLEYMFFESHK